MHPLDTLRGVLPHVRFDSADRVRLGGFSAPTETVRLDPGPVPEIPAVAQLQTLLYTHVYCRDWERPARPSGPADLTVELERANTISDGWERGWRVTQYHPDGRVSVRKGQRASTVRPGDFASTGPPGMPISPGDLVSLRIARGSTTYQPGFYYVFGGRAVADDFDRAVLRYYFHVRPEGAALVVRVLTEQLGGFHIPFRLKTLLRAEQMTRPDGAVLYLAKHHHPLFLALLGQVYEVLERSLGERTCLFAKPVAAGVSLAENPYSRGSFGMDRCRVVAEGCWDAWIGGASGGDDQFDSVVRRFRRYGLDPERPWLCAGNVDQYDLANFATGVP